MRPAGGTGKSQGGPARAPSPSACAPRPPPGSESPALSPRGVWPHSHLPTVSPRWQPPAQRLGFPDLSLPLAGRLNGTCTWTVDGLIWSHGCGG